MFLLAILTPAFAADPTTIAAPMASPEAPPVAAPAVSHVEMVRSTGDAPNEKVIAFVINCWPEDTNPSLGYTNSVIGFNTDTEKLAKALTARSDVGTIYVFRNPSPEELLRTLGQIDDGLGNWQYKESLVFLLGIGTQGDADTERALCRNADGVALTDVMGRIKSVAKSTGVLIDMSQDFSGASDLGQTLGYTANDVFDNVPNGFAISAGPQGESNGPGFMPAVISTIEESAGKPMTAGELVVGIRVKAPSLEVSSSLGRASATNSWTAESLVLSGGPLIVPHIEAVAALPTAKLTKPKHGIKSGWYLAGGGGVALVGGGISTSLAMKDYDTLVGFNNDGGETPEELTSTVGSFRTKAYVAGGLGGLGALALIGGITWVVLDHGPHTVTLTPTLNGAAVTGQF